MQILLVTTLLLLAVGVMLYGRHRLGIWLGLPLSALTILIACWLWNFHLRSGGLPRAWGLLFSALMAGQLLLWIFRHLRGNVAAWQGAMGCAAFTYAMLWVVRSRDRNAGLRSLATAALLLSIGILAKPAVLICCVLVSAAVFFDEREKVGGLLHSALLLLTPVLLSLFAVAALHALSDPDVARLAWSISRTNLQPPHLHFLSLAQEIPGLSFCAGVLTSRLLMRKTAIPDLAFLFLIVFLSTLGMAHWMPKPMSQLELSMIITWGAACLLALDPPASRLTRAVVLAGASLSLWFVR